MYSEEKPVEVASDACSSKLSTVFLNCVAFNDARPLAKERSIPPSSSLAVSGLIPSAPLIVDNRAPPIPSLNTVVANVNLPAVGKLPARPYARRNFKSPTVGGTQGDRSEAENFG